MTKTPHILRCARRTWTAALALLYAATVLVTVIVTNNAAAAMMIPLALAAAAKLNADAMPFVIAVAMGASSGAPLGLNTWLMKSMISCFVPSSVFDEVANVGARLPHRRLTAGDGGRAKGNVGS